MKFPRFKTKEDERLIQLGYTVDRDKKLSEIVADYLREKNTPKPDPALMYINEVNKKMGQNRYFMFDGSAVKLFDEESLQIELFGDKIWNFQFCDQHNYPDGKRTIKDLLKRTDRFSTKIFDCYNTWIKKDESVDRTVKLCDRITSSLYNSILILMEQISSPYCDTLKTCVSYNKTFDSIYIFKRIAPTDIDPIIEGLSKLGAPYLKEYREYMIHSIAKDIYRSTAKRETVVFNRECQYDTPKVDIQNYPEWLKGYQEDLDREEENKKCAVISEIEEMFNKMRVEVKNA